MKRFWMLCVLAWAGWAGAEMPAGHLFYSHGAIVEGENPRPEHPRYGIYDFPAVVDALRGLGWQVHARHRPAGQSVDQAAAELAAEVRRWLDTGVAPAHIALLGFSRGGVITLKASQLLDEPEIRLVLQAACFQGLRRRALDPSGRLYVMYEQSDRVGSCRPLLPGWPRVKLMDEKALDTGLGHGAFYRPDERWLSPLWQWLN